MKQNEKQSPHQLERGVIQDNYLKAIVTDKLFRSRIEKNKKGKGSYRRNDKHRRSDEYSVKIAA